MHCNQKESLVYIWDYVPEQRNLGTCCNKGIQEQKTIGHIIVIGLYFSSNILNCFAIGKQVM